VAGPPEAPDATHERAELQAAQQRVNAQLAAVEAELAAARKAARMREVELLLDTRTKVLDTRTKLHEQKSLQLALQVEAARRAPLSSTGAWLQAAASAASGGVQARASRVRAPAPDAPWTNSPWFSPTLAKIGLSTPWEQWGFFGSAAGGCIYAGRQYVRAHHVLKFVETDNVEHLYMANVPSTEAARARFLVSRFRMQGAAAAVLSPLLWLAWRNAREPPLAGGSGDAGNRHK